MARILKLGVSIAALSFAGGVFHTHSTGSIYSGLPIGVAIAIVAIFASTYVDSQHFIAGLAAIVSLAAVYRLYIYAFPASMMHYDPDAYAVQSQVIVNSGFTDGLVGGFYKVAPLFTIFGAETGLVLGVPIDTAYAIFPLMAALVIPLFAAVLARRVVGDPRAPIAAAAVGAVFASVVEFSVAPTPLLLAALFVGASITVLSMAGDWLPPRHTFLVLLFALAAGLTHKVPLLILTATVVGMVGYSALYAFASRRSVGRLQTTLAILFGLMLALQWAWMTQYLDNALLHILGIVGLGGLPTGGIANPAAATRVDPTAVVTTIQHGWFLFTVPIAVLAGVLLIARSHLREVRLLQAAGAVTILFASLGVFISAAPGFQRTFAYGAIFVAALVGVGAVLVSQSSRPGTTGIAFSVVVVILVANPLSVYAAPDYPDTPRVYLTTQEVEGKAHANTYVAGEVHRDVFYADEAIDFQRAAREGDWNQRTVPQERSHPGLMSEEFINGTMIEADHQYVGLRTQVDVHRLGGCLCRLTWDPESSMDQSYNRVYSNGGSVLYSNTA